MYLPERTHQGTPSQRHESMKSRRAQKVSTSEFLTTPGSFADAQGPDIHVAQGEEPHLPRESWNTSKGSP